MYHRILSKETLKSVMEINIILIVTRGPLLNSPEAILSAQNEIDYREAILLNLICPINAIVLFVIAKEIRQIKVI